MTRPLPIGWVAKVRFAGAAEALWVGPVFPRGERLVDAHAAIVEACIHTFPEMPEIETIRRGTLVVALDVPAAAPLGAIGFKPEPRSRQETLHA